MTAKRIALLSVVAGLLTLCASLALYDPRVAGCVGGTGLILLGLFGFDVGDGEE